MALFIFIFGRPCLEGRRATGTFFFLFFFFRPFNSSDEGEHTAPLDWLIYAFSLHFSFRGLFLLLHLVPFLIIFRSRWCHLKWKNFFFLNLILFNSVALFKQNKFNLILLYQKLYLILIKNIFLI